MKLLFLPRFLSVTLLAGLASCATERTVTNGIEPTENRPTDLMDRFAGGFSVKKDQNGDAAMVSDRRSSFEGKKYTGDTSTIEKKQYETKPYEKKEFDGARTQYATKTWGGRKSFTDTSLNTPDFITHAKGVETPQWNDAGKTFATAQSDQQGKVWAEGSKQFERTVNEDIEAKRKSFRQPTKMSTKEYQAHSMDETRALLGRDD